MQQQIKKHNIKKQQPYNWENTKGKFTFTQNGKGRSILNITHCTADCLQSERPQKSDS